MIFHLRNHNKKNRILKLLKAIEIRNTEFFIILIKDCRPTGIKQAILPVKIGSLTTWSGCFLTTALPFSVSFREQMIANFIQAVLWLYLAGVKRNHPFKTASIISAN
ncbi:MAG: hypothetical protein WAN36_03615 [Calditrichia bacterium]